MQESTTTGGTHMCSLAQRSNEFPFQNDGDKGNGDKDNVDLLLGWPFPKVGDCTGPPISFETNGIYVHIYSSSL